MTRVLMAITGSDHWTLADGTPHATGFWPEELIVPHQKFTDAGYDLVLATPGGVRPVPDQAGFTPEMNGGDSAAGERFRDYLASIDAVLAAPADLHAMSADDFDAVFVPGGHGPMEDLAVDADFGRLLNQFDDAGKIVSAVCHGPAALLSATTDDGAWTFAGRRVTGFANTEETQIGFAESAPWLLQDRLTDAGGSYESADEAWAPHIVADGNLFTGQNPGSTGPLADVLVEALADVDSAANVA
ncbi:type 1 glutamine amidotransferase domain-containing protein [Gordonia hydrophobica]|uniref:Type 1 glutamine amidotransferase domain-containing protein n=1 Tax=Gordonia hydrophobica TaxID=40516 RepID=A0ABZ2U4A3_9ACTN|nr:type 1 glutamine amidotransferase domain-containing protein [Gordonia hydrophobica]MBM7368074.1 putative intracellular protease/amidase [Gordonia hydrophobica]